MKINEGFISTKEYFRRMQAKFDRPVIKQKKVYEWQDLAAKICKELKVPKNEQSLIYKVCRDNPKPFIEHYFNETIELTAKNNKGLPDDLKGHYFIKLVYKANNA